MFLSFFLYFFPSSLSHSIPPSFPSFLVTGYAWCWEFLLPCLYFKTFPPDKFKSVSSRARASLYGSGCFIGIKYPGINPDWIYSFSVPQGCHGCFSYNSKVREFCCNRRVDSKETLVEECCTPQSSGLQFENILLLQNTSIFFPISLFCLYQFL